ncbi:J domain-containing protein [Bradyrhizobium sp. Tv2a-2]|uniref:J domain-containing protein n=1 Tax=Bradyrhizobium sp. Tv2a-2 TaxID=113395 RepID=UPI00041E819E|nr:J domain-containing protein [Bradyrhizobium sp. Tv2a-2]
MDTLYDLLGALPRDDADGLRTAFRRAVKGTHPDLNPGDPDAGQKFRQIMRAQDILLDGEQRAVYDHLLALARLEAAEDAEHAAQNARAGKIHLLASWVMTLAGASAISIAGLALIALLWTSTEPAADTGLATDEPAPIQVATVPEQPAPTPMASTEAATPAAVAPAETTNSALPPLGPPLDITPPPGPPTLDRTRSFNRAFADISHGKHPGKAGRSANAKKKGSDAAEGGAGPTPPTPPRHAAANDLSRLESAPFSPRP